MGSQMFVDWYHIYLFLYLFYVIDFLLFYLYQYQKPGPVDFPHKGPVTRKMYHNLFNFTIINALLWITLDNNKYLLSGCYGTLSGFQLGWHATVWTCITRWYIHTLVFWTLLCDSYGRNISNTYYTGCWVIYRKLHGIRALSGTRGRIEKHNRLTWLLLKNWHNHFVFNLSITGWVENSFPTCLHSNMNWLLALSNYYILYFLKKYSAR